MKRSLKLLIVGCALAAAPVPSLATVDPSLYLDGRLRVEGALLHGAHMSVLRDGVPMMDLTDELQRIRVRLDLQATYTLSFDQPGCRTKEILIDTRMDEEAVKGAPYTFLFDVTLDQEIRVGTAPYAGPVGYVRFVPGTNNFGYDLDYRLTHDAHGNVFAEDSSMDIPTSAGRHISTRRARNERHLVQPFIDPTRDMERMASAQATKTSTTAARMVGTAQGITPVSAAAAASFNAATMTRTVILEQERVITIVRLIVNGRPSEYRKVVSNNGTVLHYKDGSNCTYASYVSAVGTE